MLYRKIESYIDYTVHSALNKFLKVETYNIHQAFVLSNEQKIYQQGGITYIPIYYIMFFEPGTTVMGSFLE